MRNKLLLLFVIIASCVFISCKPSNDKIKNDIKIKEDGLHVEEAYLTVNNAQTVPEGNKVQVGERVSLRLIIDGWHVKNGRVFFDASQRTASSSGTTLAINPSMFGQVYTQGATLRDAKYVLLYQTMGRLDDPKNHIVITFKVWDKITNKSVSGSYELYM